MEKIFFLIVAGLAVTAGLSVVLQRNPLYSAFSLIGLFGCLAMIYLTLQAQFIATIQIIVYAGAIMVLFVFVIMLLNVRREELQLDHYRFLYYLAVPFGALLFFEVYYSVSRLRSVEVAKSAVGDSTSIGIGLFSHYLLPFEITSILILMAIVGSVILARREKE
ncbi:MAG: NADH-quinone oxidoreductase subunit J [Acidobacteriota bacterium]